MASTRREKELARLRAERQAARRAEAAAKRKRRNTIVAEHARGAARRRRGRLPRPAQPRRRHRRHGATPRRRPTRRRPRPPRGRARTPRRRAEQAGHPAARHAHRHRAGERDHDDRPGGHHLALATDKAPCAGGEHDLARRPGLLRRHPLPPADHRGDLRPAVRRPDRHRLRRPRLPVRRGEPRGRHATRAAPSRWPRRGDPGTNGSQFFLVYQDTELPPKYTPFGHDHLRAGRARQGRGRRRRPSRPGHAATPSPNIRSPSRR